MNLAIVILLLVVCIVLGFFVLIQNPKGGGLAGNFGGLGQQMMGVQQSTDTVEKGTWILGALMGLICIGMVALSGGKKSNKTDSEEALKGFTGGINTPITAPATGPATGSSTNSGTATAPATAPASATPSTSASAQGGAQVQQGNPPQAPVTPAEAQAATSTK